MRTTLNVDPELLAEAKIIAARTHRPLGAVVDDALRTMLSRTGDDVAPPAAVSLPTDGGSGLQPGVDLEDKDALAELLGD
jgi:plasmid stability protein